MLSSPPQLCSLLSLALAGVGAEPPPGGSLLGADSCGGGIKCKCKPRLVRVGFLCLCSRPLSHPCAEQPWEQHSKKEGP